MDGSLESGFGPDLPQRRVSERVAISFQVYWTFRLYFTLFGSLCTVDEVVKLFSAMCHLSEIEAVFAVLKIECIS